MRNMAPAGPRKTARERAAAAYQLRCIGRTWTEIAAAQGFGSHTAAHTAVRRHIARMPTEDQDLARALSAGTYQLIKAQLFELAAASKAKGHERSAAEAMVAAANVQERHDRLVGIQAPTKVDVTVTGTAITVIERAEEQLLALAAQTRAAIPSGLPVLDVEAVEVPQ